MHGFMFSSRAAPSSWLIHCLWHAAASTWRNCQNDDTLPLSQPPLHLFSVVSVLTTGQVYGDEVCWGDMILIDLQFHMVCTQRVHESTNKMNPFSPKSIREHFSQSQVSLCSVTISSMLSIRVIKYARSKFIYRVHRSDFFFWWK